MIYHRHRAEIQCRCTLAYKRCDAARRKQGGSLLPPKHILNSPTKLMKSEGYGGGYRIRSRSRRKRFQGRTTFPEALGRRTFYDPPDRGFEREIRKRLDYWREAEKGTQRLTDFKVDLDAYFTRIGFDGPRAPTLDVLTRIHLAASCRRSRLRI